MISSTVTLHSKFLENMAFHSCLRMLKVETTSVSAHECALINYLTCGASEIMVFILRLLSYLLIT